MKLFRYAAIDSTNQECFRKFDRGESLPFIVVAKTQTHGKGQFGRTWYSADEHNLYISFAFIPKQIVQVFQNFSTIVAEQIADQLQSTFEISLKVKPPNDIYSNDKKLCGILTESRIINKEIIMAVTGIGLNVASDLSKFPSELQGQVTTLSDCCKRRISLPKVEKLVIDAMYLLLSNAI
jgi:BirA family biotin operon repressor/biotin-[acetyl-CoA-carboxylase] ligase